MKSKMPTFGQIKNAYMTIGSDESAFIMRINKLEHEPLSKIRPIKAIFNRKQIKFHHPLQWEQKKYPKIPK